MLTAAKAQYGEGDRLKMRYHGCRPFIVLILLVGAVFATGQLRMHGEQTGSAPTTSAATGPDTAPAKWKFPTTPPYQQTGASYTGQKLLSWHQVKVDGKSCRVSPPLKVPADYEINHHRVTVRFAGPGKVSLSLAHHAGDKLEAALAARHLHSRFETVTSGQEISIVSPYKGQRYAWVVVHTTGQVRIASIRHTCTLARGTLYGHIGRSFEFAGGNLPYRLMYPKNYDPRKAYPLVISVAGSGSVGTDNVRSMEMVILGRYFFTHYFHDKQLACFSLVTQIPPNKVVPPPYWPAGPRGRPTAYHPDWPAVNENGWYVQATLALIEKLKQAEGLNIDPDRVYYTGFSYGGKACWEFLRAGREVFAAGICGGGWPIGRAFSNPAGKTLERLKLELRRHKHIPVLIFAGGKDPMRFGSQAAHKEILAAGGKSTYVEFLNVGHVPSANKGWANRKHVGWLFEQNRKNNPTPGADCFPGGVYEDNTEAKPQD